ncbi:MAG: hypothetical protein RLY57_228 [Candidatus Parcubacteria bacterium]|jgi:phosphoglycerol transferase MdoB-like AlkP superfamily enzyme
MNIDIIVLAAIGIFFVFTAYRYGKSYLTAFILSFYPAYFLYDIVKGKVSSKEPAVIVGLFVVVFVLVLYVLRRTVSAGFAFTNAKRWIDAIVLSAGALAQIAFVYYVFLPQLSALYNVSGVVDGFFNGVLSTTILALIPFVALVVSARE